MASDAVAVPDSALAEAVTDLLAAAAPQVLVNHCRRTYQFGWALGKRRGWKVDRETLYICATLHDLGLTERYDGPAGFEVQGAAAAESFLIEQGCPPERATLVKDAIALHLDGVAAVNDPRPEVVLTAMGTGLDTHGFRVDEIDPRLLDKVVENWPRLGFREWLRRACFDQAERKPESRVAWWVNGGYMGPDIGNPPFTE
ncbi:HD domain-containing protein [Nocardia terpenica]|uniref:HD domain-containing protein n=1 Tax=Nocardia terpenica TaxID=455432 RepID=UPI0008348531|nr:HD domain-containing protein [Nocardia terpenica]NQE93653.1 HD domain-containing protein [Nocardia terpenica]